MHVHSVLVFLQVGYSIILLFAIHIGITENEEKIDGASHGSKGPIQSSTYVFIAKLALVKCLIVHACKSASCLSICQIVKCNFLAATQ